MDLSLASRFLHNGATAKSLELSSLQHGLALPRRIPKPRRRSVSSQVPYGGRGRAAKGISVVVVDTAAGGHVKNPHWDFERYLSAHTQAMNKELDAALASLPCPERLSDAMRHYVLAGGKRQCSMVAVACCELVGGTGTASAALPLACALEMILTASLIHDDMPCMDDAALRRGVPSCHVAFGEPVALQAGVALVALAFEHVARSGAGAGAGIPTDLTLRLRAVAELAQATGVGGIAAGQVADMESEGTAADHAISLSTLEYIHVRKTARLLEAAAALGAAVGGGSDAEVEHLRRYARAVGLLFQLVNDVLDVMGTTELLGQVTGKDAAAGKRTYVRLMGVEGARAYAAELVARAEVQLQGFDAERAAPLRYFPRFLAYQLHLHREQ